MAEAYFEIDETHDIGGRRAFSLPSGETRTFLEDGDEVQIRALPRREGFVPIGFGECRGRIVGGN